MSIRHTITPFFLLLVPLLGVALGQPQHPNLLFNRQELAELGY